MTQNNQYHLPQVTYDRVLIDLKQSSNDLKNEESFSLWKSLNTIETPQFQSQTGEKWDDWGQSILFGVPELWSNTEGKGVKIALLDSGIDRTHPALTNACDEHDHCDLIDEKNADDENGHGTHCAGLIAGRLTDGFAGVAPKAKLINIKVFGKKQSTDAKTIVRGIRRAIKHGAHIISMSFGGTQSDPELYEAIHEALAKGILIICAAGNSGSRYQNNIDFPGRYGSVITIASHDENGNTLGSSSRGGEIDFMAPGKSILSTWKGGGYGVATGTSVATALVSGLAALIKAKHIEDEQNNKQSLTPLHNNEDLREHLLRMAAHPGNHTNSEGYGPLTSFKYIDLRTSSTSCNADCGTNHQGRCQQIYVRDGLRCYCVDKNSGEIIGIC